MAATTGSMGCPQCPGGTHVIDSRYNKTEATYRRRRRCDRCGYRFTTYEITEERLQAVTTAETFLVAVRRAI